MKYILSKEYEFEGQKYTEIELNLDVLTGCEGREASD